MKKRAAKIGLIAVEVAAVLVAVFVAGAAYLFVRLERGPVDLAIFKPSAEFFVSRNLPDDYHAGLTGLGLSRGAGRGNYVLTIENLAIHDPEGVQSASMPEITLSFGAGNFLRGEFGPHTVTAENPTFRVVRNEAQDVKIEAFRGEARGGKSLRRLFTPLSDGRFLNSAFKSARLNDARVTFLDTTSQRSWLSENANVEIVRTDNGLTASLGADIAMDETTASLQGRALYADESGIISVDLQGSNVPIGDLLTMFYGNGAAVLDAPVSGAASIAFTAGGDVLSSRFAARAGRGTMTLGAASGPVESIEWKASFDPARNAFEIEQLVFDINGSSGAVAGAVTIERAGDARTPGKVLFDLQANDLIIDAKEFLPEPLPISVATISGDYQVSERKLQLSSFDAALLGVRFSGELGFHVPKITSPAASRSIGVKAAVAMDGALDPARLLRLWPIGAAMGARDWVEDRVTHATLDNIVIDIDLTPGVITEDGLIPDAALALSFDAHDVRAFYVKQMPPITGASGSGVLRGNSFLLKASKGRVGDVALSAGEVEFPVFIPKWEPTYIRFTATGRSQDMLDILNQKPLSLLEKVSLSPAQFQGLAEARIEIMRPNKRDAAPEEYQYSGTASFKEMTVTGLAGGEDLDGAKGEVELGSRSMVVKADAMLSGAPVNVRWRKNYFREDGPSSIAFAGTIDSSTADLFGLSSRRYLRGPVVFSADAIGDLGAFQSVAVEADLTDAAMSIGSLGWRKIAGAPASASANIVMSDDGFTIEDIKLSGDGVGVEGKIAFAPSGALLSAELGRFFLEGATALSLTASRSAGGALKLTAIGDYLNAAPIIETILAGASQGDSSINWGSGVIINARIDKMGFREGVEHDVVSMGLWHDGAELQSLTYSGFDHDGPPLTVNFAHLGEVDAARQTIEARTSQIGSLLAGVFGLKSVQGGEGTLLINLGGDGASGFSGVLNARDIRMVEAPLLARVFSVGSLTGLSDLLNGEGIEFDSAYGEFSFKDNVLMVTGVRASGPSLGITAQGEVIMGATGEVALNGAIAPLYQVNSILGNAPIIGDILVGKEGEGIFALSYQVTGEASAPYVVVNPLSALTPGIFRNLFQPARAVTPDIDDNIDDSEDQP